MKFLHVYDERTNEGLYKNGLLNKDSGFKIQHDFPIPDNVKFNVAAKKGGKFYNLIKETGMPCYVDSLCWVVSLNDEGKRFVTIFNNEGNERSLEHGDTVDKNCDKRVTITLKDSDELSVVKEELGSSNVEKVGDKTYCATIPAAGFVILEF